MSTPGRLEVLWSYIHETCFISSQKEPQAPLKGPYCSVEEALGLQEGHKAKPRALPGVSCFLGTNPEVPRFGRRSILGPYHNNSLYRNPE